MNCKSCGSELPEGSRFCNMCGASCGAERDEAQIESEIESDLDYKGQSERKVDQTPPGQPAEQGTPQEQEPPVSDIPSDRLLSSG